MPNPAQAISAQGYSTPPRPYRRKGLRCWQQRCDGRRTNRHRQNRRFSLPILHLLQQRPRASSNRCRALILTPTRELAAQVADNIRDYSEFIPSRTAVVLVASASIPQMQTLRRGVEVLVACPGRLLDLHQQTPFASMKWVLVLDKPTACSTWALFDIKRILALLPKKRQNLMFSATFSDDIRALAKGLVHDPVEIDVSPRNSTARSIKQWLIPVDKRASPHCQPPDSRPQLATGAGVYPYQTRCEPFNQLSARTKISAAAIHGNKSQAHVPARWPTLKQATFAYWSPPTSPHAAWISNSCRMW